MTVGLSALLGYELETRRSPEPAGLAIAALLAVAQEMVCAGLAPRDGAVVHPFDPDALPHRLRRVPQGVLGNDTDRWCLVHPESPFDDLRLLGPPEAAGAYRARLRSLARAVIGDAAAPATGSVSRPPSSPASSPSP
jgi:hypothetical protein